MSRVKRQEMADRLNRALKELTAAMVDTIGQQPLLMVTCNTEGDMSILCPVRLSYDIRQEVLEAVQAWVKAQVQ